MAILFCSRGNPTPTSKPIPIDQRDNQWITKPIAIRALRLGLYTFLATVTADGLHTFDLHVLEQASIAGLAAVLSVVEDMLRPTDS